VCFATISPGVFVFVSESVGRHRWGVCVGVNTFFVSTPARSPCAFELSFSCSLRIRDAETAGVPAAPGEEEAAERELGLDLVWWLLISTYRVRVHHAGLLQFFSDYHFIAKTQWGSHRTNSI